MRFPVVLLLAAIAALALAFVLWPDSGLGEPAVPEAVAPGEVGEIIARGMDLDPRAASAGRERKRA